MVHAFLLQYLRVVDSDYKTSMGFVVGYWTIQRVRLRDWICFVLFGGQEDLIGFDEDVMDKNNEEYLCIASYGDDKINWELAEEDKDN